ncbi:putative disease resistance RPP13-like protein 1 [Neltuma alba]|uniref:putative disease resistance RPP13-like protein 1 n=1 Tax=Neltuma alba TaxID=207710 RepID=UPI0010A526DD|nr:putative disease resistance RPP13-like protein 1 [Prosopis alba]
MGGIGKTTLAQVVYNNDQVKQKFDLRAWVCVSEEFDVPKITNNIIESVTSHACDMKDLNLLQLDLKEMLCGKKFLIVLDDIWNENYLEWDLLRRPFLSGTKGSKILVTTRSEKVASVVRTLSSYHAGQLSDDDCWLIFAKHACLYMDSVVDSNLESLGRDIVNKCKGLPLVAKTLGGLLRFKRDIRDWNMILKSEMWDLSEEESEILPALRISYHYLSPQLKQCFVYCSMFPKDYEFEKGELILWSMAEGFLETSMKGKTLEEVGEEYLHDLVSRSFFQPLLQLQSGKGNEITDMTRHVFCGEGDFSSISKAKPLRTILVRKECGGFVPSNRFSKLKCLRVLSLYNVLSGALPDSINKLIHWRYLNLSRTSIKKLPDNLCLLYNQQMLIVRGCDGLTKLPNDMKKLVSLRYLDASHSQLQAMPRGIGELKKLHFLSDFVLNRVEGARIKELDGLQNLSSSLTIMNLQHVSNGEEASGTRLVDKRSIEILSLTWNDAGDIARSRETLDNLQPHVNLKCLHIYGYNATAFSNWLGCPLYCKMVRLILYDCFNCSLLPPLGQLPSLQTLQIEGFDALVKISPEFYKRNDDTFLATPFPSLEILEFREMPVLQEWGSLCPINAFPKLKHLTLKDCPRLSDHLPSYLPDLATLRIDGCDHLAASIPRARSIYISGCKNMDFLGQHHFELVESIIITNSSETLSCLSSHNIPNLQQLIMTGCKNLKSVVFTRVACLHLKH